MKTPPLFNKSLSDTSISRQRIFALIPLNSYILFHDLRHTFGTRLADAGVDVVKIKKLMGHASIVTTMRSIHGTDQGKRGAIIVLSEYRQQRRQKSDHKLVTNEKRQALQPAASH